MESAEVKALSTSKSSVSSSTAVAEAPFNPVAALENPFPNMWENLGVGAMRDDWHCVLVLCLPCQNCMRHLSTTRWLSPLSSQTPNSLISFGFWPCFKCMKHPIISIIILWLTFLVHLLLWIPCASTHPLCPSHSTLCHWCSTVPFIVEGEEDNHDQGIEKEDWLTMNLSQSLEWDRKIFLFTLYKHLSKSIRQFFSSGGI